MVETYRGPKRENDSLGLAGEMILGKVRERKDAQMNEG